MSEKIQKQVGKAIIVHCPTMRALILRLEPEERAKRSTPDRAYDEWHVPGGSLEERDGGSTEAAAVREGSEETGLDVRVVHKIGEAAWDAFYEREPAHFTADFYLCTAAGDQSEPPEVVIGRESADSAWVTVDELSGYMERGLTAEADQYIREGLRQLAEVQHG